MDNTESGFYCGNKAFEMLHKMVVGENPEHVARFEYNGYKIIRHEMQEPSTCVGVGEPYSSIAGQFQDIISSHGG